VSDSAAGDAIPPGDDSSADATTDAVVADAGGDSSDSSAATSDSGPPPIDASKDTGVLTDAAGAPDATEAGSTALWTFTDDFELGDFRRWDNAPAVPAGSSLAVVDAGAYAGCCAMQATTPAGGKTWSYLYETWTTASGPTPGPANVVTSGTIAVREQLKAIALDYDTREFAFTQGGAASTGDATGGLGSGDNGATWQWGVFLQTPTVPGSMSLASAATVGGPDGLWHCVEMVMNVASPNGYLSVFVDGVATPEVAMGVDTTIAGGWDSATLGLSYSGGTNAASVLLDNVQVAIYSDQSPTIHIGCGP
jgi:hypothetical protein